MSQKNVSVVLKGTFLWTQKFQYGAGVLCKSFLSFVAMQHLAPITKIRLVWLQSRLKKWKSLALGGECCWGWGRRERCASSAYALRLWRCLEARWAHGSWAPRRCCYAARHTQLEMRECLRCRAPADDHVVLLGPGCRARNLDLTACKVGFFDNWVETQIWAIDT